MNCNVGPNERVARLVLGGSSVVAALMLRRSPVWATTLGIAGMAEIVTGLTRYCPVNALLGIDNCVVGRPNEWIHFKRRQGLFARQGS